MQGMSGTRVTTGRKIEAMHGSDAPVLSTGLGGWWGRAWAGVVDLAGDVSLQAADDLVWGSVRSQALSHIRSGSPGGSHPRAPSEPGVSQTSARSRWTSSDRCPFQLRGGSSLRGRGVVSRARLMPPHRATSGGRRRC